MDQQTKPTERVARLVYGATSGLVPRYRQHSALAQVVHNVRSAGTVPSTPAALRTSRLLTKAWTSPAVPAALCVAHLYVIALYLRNPFQKVELE